MHAGLTDYAPDGALGPGLAHDWQISADGLEWIFQLHEGLRWSDGHPLTADDVVWSAQRLVDPSASFANLGDFYLVENARAVLAGEAPPQALGVTAVNARTVVFRLTTPLGLFPVLMREFYPFPRHVIERVGIDWTDPSHFVSAGAYTLAGQSQLALDLTANPHFHDADTVSIPAIRVDAVHDAATRVRLFRSGDYDLVERPPANQLAFLQDRLGPRFRSFDAPFLRYIKLNHARVPLGDHRVRRALTLAIDRAFIAREFFGDTARPTSHVIPGAQAGGPDHDAARDLLNTAGFAPGEMQLELRAIQGRDDERIAIAIADDWARIGVETTLLATYPTDLYQAVDGGDYDAAIASFNRGLKNDPFFMLDPFEPDGLADNFNWRDSEFAALMQQARAQSNAEDRASTYAAAEQRLLDQAAIIPLLHERAHWLVEDRVLGTRTNTQPMLWRNLSLAN